MDDLKEFQKTASLNIASARKEISDLCSQEVEQYKEIYKKLHKSFKAKRLVRLYSITVAFLAVSLFMGILPKETIDYRFLFIISIFLLGWGIVLLSSVYSLEDKVVCQLDKNQILGEIISSVKKRIKKITDKNISPEVHNGLLELAQAIERDSTFFYQDFKGNATNPRLEFYYNFGNLRYNKNGGIELCFISSFSFEGKTWHGLPSHTNVSLDESLNTYEFARRDRVF